MARLKRRWRVAKWAGVSLSLLILGAWGISILRGYVVNYSAVRERVDGTTEHALESSLEDGTFEVRYHWQLFPNDLHVKPLSLKLDYYDMRSPRVIRWPIARVRHLGNGHWYLWLALWFPLLLVVLPTAYVFYLDRGRLPPHCCQACGYDLTGNTSGTCPECGKHKGASHGPKD